MSKPDTGRRAAEMPRQMTRRFEQLLFILFLAAIYFAAGKGGLSLAYVNPSATAVWPPTGVGLAALLLGGLRLWPGVFLGAVLVNAAVPGHFGTDLVIACGNTLEAIAGACLVRRFAGGAKFPDQSGTVFRFALVAGFLSTLVSATIGVTALCIAREALWSEYARIWVTWWLGDMMGALVIAPLLIIWASRSLWRPFRAWEGLLCLATIITVDLFAFHFRHSVFPVGEFKYMTFLPILWAAFRFGPHGAITGVFATAGWALFATLQNQGPFVGADPNSALLSLQVYAGALTLTGLAVAGMVTERRTGEERLEYALGAACESEQRERARAAELQTIMQAVPAVIWIAQDPDCRVITGNPASYQILRLPPTTNASKTAVAGKPDHFEVLSQGVPLRPEELPVQRAARGEEIRDFEEELRFRDGTTHFLVGNATPLRDPNGKITGAVAAFVDITARKKAEQALRAREAELDAIINRTPFMFTRCSRDLKYRFASRAYAQMIGRTPEEVIGQPIREIMGPDGFATIEPHIQEVLRGVPVEYESEVPFKEAGRRFLHVVYTPELDKQGTVTGWIASMLDITARKAAEAALSEAQARLAEHAASLEKTVEERTARLRETVQELQTLSYSIAHDMRAPLRAMSAFADLLLAEESTLSPEGRDYCQRIIKGADRLDSLIHDALNYTKTVLQELPLAAVPLGPLLRGLVDTYPNFHPENADIELAPDLPVVLGNQSLLTQCFSNLLANAVKFVPPGTKPRIRVWAVKDGARATLSVQDNGIGIAREHQSQLFGMFHKLDYRYEGTGIGLAIVRKSVERMNGTVGVESDVGAGSRFWVELPLAPAPAQAG